MSRIKFHRKFSSTTKRSNVFQPQMETLEHRSLLSCDGLSSVFHDDFSDGDLTVNDASGWSAAQGQGPAQGNGSETNSAFRFDGSDVGEGFWHLFEISSQDTFPVWMQEPTTFEFRTGNAIVTQNNPNSEAFGGADLKTQLGVLSANEPRSGSGGFPEENESNLHQNSEGGFYVELHYQAEEDDGDRSVFGSIRVVNATKEPWTSSDTDQGVFSPATFRLPGYDGQAELITSISINNDGWSVEFSHDVEVEFMQDAVEATSNVITGDWSELALNDAFITDEFLDGAYLFAMGQNVEFGRGAVDLTQAIVCYGDPFPPDVFEPNDSMGNARDLGSGNQTHDDLTIHKPDNEDWYRWEAANSGNLNVNLGFRHADGDVDLALYDSNGNLITNSVSDNDNEQINAFVNADEGYFLQVYGYQGATNPSYSLAIDLDSDNPHPVADLLVSIDDGLNSIAAGDFIEYRITVDNNGPGEVMGATITDIFPSELMELSYSSTAFDGATGNTSGPTSGNIHDTVNMPVGSSIVYTVTATVDPNATGTFSNSASVLPPSDVDDPVDANNMATDVNRLIDAMEPNGSFVEAISLGYGNQTHSGLGFHDFEDEDWFSWTALNAGTSSVQIDFSDEAGNLDLELYDSSGQLLSSANSNSDNEIVEWEAIADEKYVVRVHTDSALLNPDYRLRFHTPGDSENYAVLFSGGIDKSLNYKRYYDNVRGLYDTLVDDYDLNPNNIFVLHADGTNTAVDRSDGRNSDLSFATNVLSATANNLRTTLTTLSNRIDSNDHFLFWSFDHGGGTHHDRGEPGYDANAPNIKGEEELNGWGTDIADEDLAAWLNTINAGHTTLVYAQCFAGGMLDDLLPLTTNTFGMAATNHYEFSYGDGFAAAFRKALANGHRNTYDAYKYAHNHDGFAAKMGTYAANAGTYAYGVEHPWAANQSNFPIFARNSNAAPQVATMRELPAWDSADDLVIPFDWLLAAGDERDQDGDRLSFRIELVPVGELLKEDVPVVPGETLVSFGESLIWRRPDGIDASIVDAFSVRAFDGSAISTKSVSVPLRLVPPSGEIAALDDEFEVAEHIADDPIPIDDPLPILDNDHGQGELSVLDVGSALHGTVELVEGAVRYIPAPGYVGRDSFSYSLIDATGETDIATVHLQVTPVNDAPIARLNEVIVAAGSEDNLIDVVTNDYDGDNDPLLAVLVSGPSHGSLTNPTEPMPASPWHQPFGRIDDAAFHYTPHPGFVGTDSFTYKVTDGQLDSNEVTVSIIVDAGLAGDTNKDGELDARDIDTLFAAIRAKDSDPCFDLNKDDEVDRQDSDFLIESILNTSVGDANLDGIFDSADLVKIFQAGEYEDRKGNSGWATGDWNGDGEFDSSDLVIAFQKGHYTS